MILQYAGMRQVPTLQPEQLPEQHPNEPKQEESLRSAASSISCYTRISLSE